MLPGYEQTEFLRFFFTVHGSVGESNDVTLMGLNHKMGWRGTTNTALAFGENGKCKGYLIGQVCACDGNCSRE